MKTFNLIISALSILWLTSCVQASLIEEVEKQETKMVEVDLNLDFSTKEDAWVNSKGVDSRATIAESEVTHIALKVFDSDNNAVLDTIQTKTDLGDKFGILNDLRISAGTYTFVVVAHNAATKENPQPAIINSPTEVIIPETNLYETYATVKKSVEIGIYESTNINLTLSLMVTKLTFKVMDAITPETAFVRATVNTDATEAESLTINPTTGLFTTDAAFSKSWKISSIHIGKTDRTFNIIAGLTDYTTGINLKLEALDSDENVIYSRTFTDIELNRAKRRTLNTNLFTGGTETTIELEEWGDDEDITIK